MNYSKVQSISDLDTFENRIYVHRKRAMKTVNWKTSSFRNKKRSM